MSSASKFALKVTAGGSYTTHEPVPVNSEKSINISTDAADIELVVRIKDFRPPPNSSLKTTCPYFDGPTHRSTRYSIAFALTPKRTLSADDVVLGNDFDEPIKDYLPPFFGAGLKVVKSTIDPGLEGDPYAEKPWLYGPLASSVNVMRIGSKGDTKKGMAGVLEEGGDGEDAAKIREEAGIPDRGPARMKFFLDKEKREKFEFEVGRRYEFDFYNGYLDFNEFSLKLPLGISFNLLRQMGDTKIPPLRYVLKDRKSQTLLFHATFTLVEADSHVLKASEATSSNLVDDELD